MSSTWTFAELVDKLRAILEADTGILALDPVPVIRVSMPHMDESISDYIVLGVDATDDGKIQALMGGHHHDEDVIVSCVATAIRYGSGDAKAKEARDRVLAILDIVDDRCRTSGGLEVGSQTLRGPTLENRSYESFPGLVGENVPVRVAGISFDLTYKARTTP